MIQVIKNKQDLTLTVVDKFCPYHNKIVEIVAPPPPTRTTMTLNNYYYDDR